MTEDTEKLETLSYKPTKHPEDCWCLKCCPEPAKTSTKVKEENTPVIEPKTRVEKGKMVDQHLEQPTRGLMKIFLPPIKTGCAIPNTDLMIIEEIEGLIVEANEKMYDLPIHPIRSKAIEDIDLLQTTTMIELRRAFE